MEKRTLALRRSEFGRILGVRGSVIKSIRATSGASVEVQRQEDMAVSADIREVYLSGTLASVEAAEDLIWQHVDGLVDAVDDTYTEEIPMYEPPKPATLTIRVKRIPAPESEASKVGSATTLGGRSSSRAAPAASAPGTAPATASAGAPSASAPPSRSKGTPVKNAWASGAPSGMKASPASTSGAAPTATARDTKLPAAPADDEPPEPPCPPPPSPSVTAEPTPTPSVTSTPITGSPANIRSSPLVAVDKNGTVRRGGRPPKGVPRAVVSSGLGHPTTGKARAASRPAALGTSLGVKASVAEETNSSCETNATNSMLPDSDDVPTGVEATGGFIPTDDAVQNEASSGQPTKAAFEVDSASKRTAGLASTTARLAAAAVKASSAAASAIAAADAMAAAEAVQECETSSADLQSKLHNALAGQEDLEVRCAKLDVQLASKTLDLKKLQATNTSLVSQLAKAELLNRTLTAELEAARMTAQAAEGKLEWCKSASRTQTA